MSPKTRLLGQRHRSCVLLGSPWPLRRRRNLPRVIGPRYLTLRIPIWFRESFNQIAKAAMNEINRTSRRTLGSAVTSQRTDRSSSNSERTSRAIVPAGPTRGGTVLKSRVVDIRKHPAVRIFLLQVAAEHPRTCLNEMSRNPAISNQAIPSGSRHLIVGDRLVRDLKEIFVSG